MNLTTFRVAIRASGRSIAGDREFRPLLRAALLSLTLAACAGHGGQEAEFERIAQAEIAAHPDRYVNGDARAYVVGLDGISHGVLWGTVHVNYGVDTIMPAALRDRFAEALDLTVEPPFDLRSSADMRTISANARKFMATPGRSSIAGLDPETQVALDAADLPRGSPDRYSVKMLASLVGAKAASDPLTYTGSTAPVDFMLIAFARQRHQAVRGLDTVERSLQAYTTDPNGPEAVAELKRALRQMAQARAFRAWVLAEYAKEHVAKEAAALEVWQADAAGRCSHAPMMFARPSCAAERTRGPRHVDRDHGSFRVLTNDPH